MKKRTYHVAYFPLCGGCHLHSDNIKAKTMIGALAKFIKKHGLEPIYIKEQ